MTRSNLLDGEVIILTFEEHGHNYLLHVRFGLATDFKIEFEILLTRERVKIRHSLLDLLSKCKFVQSRSEGNGPLARSMGWEHGCRPVSLPVV